MTELVEYLVKKVVDQPDSVTVTPFEDEHGTIFEVRVAPDDMGKVIGRGGRVANAIRTVVRSVAQRDGVNAQVEIMEPTTDATADSTTDFSSGLSGLKDYEGPAADAAPEKSA